MSATALSDLHDATEELLPDLVALREQLHRRPEIGLHLPQTQATVLAALDGLGLEVSTGRQLSSVTAVLRGGRPGPAVLLRGDMDALPVAEESGEPFSSENPGAMHACGHDMHTAGLVGAARLLAARREELPGSVVFMFQPGEEGQGGAALMIEEGVLEAAGDRVVAGYAIHVSSARLPIGVASCRPGAMLAAADSVTVTVHGRGGHGSAPHRAADPVPVAAELVLALQQAVTRQFDVFDPVVITVGKIEAGTANNVIPALAVLEVTVRTFSAVARAKALMVIDRLCTNIAAAHGLTAAVVVHEDGYPVTVNDAAEVARVTEVCQAIGVDHRPMADPITGSEDFSYVLEQVPGAFVMIGAAAADRDPATAPDNHSPQARFDSAALRVGPALLAALAIDRLTTAG